MSGRKAIIIAVALLLASVAVWSTACYMGATATWHTAVHREGEAITDGQAAGHVHEDAATITTQPAR